LTAAAPQPVVVVKVLGMPDVAKAIPHAVDYVSAARVVTSHGDSSLAHRRDVVAQTSSNCVRALRRVRTVCNH
jgi:hypothetical protein